MAVGPQLTKFTYLLPTITVLGTAQYDMTVDDDVLTVNPVDLTVNPADTAWGQSEFASLFPHGGLHGETYPGGG
jgi:hypothetical protein